jgi:multidrug efflux pump
VGRVFREFSLTLTFAVVISMFVSLSVTPMICAHFVREPPSRDRTWLDRSVEAVLSRLMAGYAKSLAFVLRFRVLTLIVLLATVALTVQLYRVTPRGYFPQDDTGLVMGWTNAAPDISFKAMAELQQQVAEIVISDPAVASVGSSVGGSAWSGSVNRGRMFIALKPLAERGGLSSARVIDRMRAKVSRVPGIGMWMRSRACQASSTSRPTACRRGCSSTSRSTGSRLRASACAFRTSRTRSTTRSRSARSRPSIPGATSIA